MTLGVLLNRRSHLKVLSPVISASMARGHTTVLVAIPTAAKKGDALDLRELERLYPGLPVKDSLIGLDVLVGIESVLPPSAPCRMVGVEHFQDAWIRPPRMTAHLTMCYTSLSLLARAKWAVHFESGAVFECAVMGAYSLAVQMPQTHIIDLPGAREQYGGTSTMHHWPGVSEYGVPRHVPRQNVEARRAYCEQFLGPCDGNAGERVVTVAEG